MHVCVCLYVGMRVHITMSLLRKVYNEHLFHRPCRLTVALPLFCISVGYHLLL